MNVDPNGEKSLTTKMKNSLKWFINVIFNDFIDNTLTNVVLILSGGGIGAWISRKAAKKGFTMLDRKIGKKTVKSFITGGLLSYVSGSWFSKVGDYISYWGSKLWKYESWFDRNWLGKKIDNGLRSARNYLIRKI
ncbi:hypothetical protein KZO01_26190 [Kurthia zopfii]|uniref:Uncharacterized protein n=2 Tax=Kurthia zopfii TaxID=1650 RepID=A0A8B4QAA3_9BACL|nr:hypothetical protein DFR61_16213 [Kurthia zopfii]GEK32310.1 hypothetical protein KZO01_26190 [Kurthia zopfii]STX09649.1 Uncharacterised protein [Kurthia zopfii]